MFKCLFWFCFSSYLHSSKNMKINTQGVLNRNLYNMYLFRNLTEGTVYLEHEISFKLMFRPVLCFKWLVKNRATSSVYCAIIYTHLSCQHTLFNMRFICLCQLFDFHVCFYILTAISLFTSSTVHFASNLETTTHQLYIQARTRQLICFMSPLYR